jgi:hypothetical protein
MASRFILTDGQKAANLLTSNDPSVWTYFSGAPITSDYILYSQVAAAYRAYNLKANTIGNMPFVLYKGKEEFDTSAKWENKVGFLPNPAELFRLGVLSYMDTNTIYNLRTSDAIGYKTKGLYHVVSRTFLPETNPATGELIRIVRTVGAQMEYYQPEDKRLFRAWRLDQNTEVLPATATEALAIMNAAGVIHSADSWIRHFFERGGVAPTVIAMKGAVAPEKRDEEQKSWTDWLLGLGKFRARIARVFNADSLTVQQFGSSVTELKDNEVYNQALANIAMGVGMPLSLLMANSANYATAKEEKATWYENDIIPFCNWLAYEYNRQVFNPIGLRMEFKPETLDPQQEDETERAAAISAFMDFMAKCPTYEVFLGACETFGYELSDTLDSAAKTYYADKKQTAQAVTAVTVQPSKPEQGPVAETQAPQPAQPQPAKWIPTLNESKELSAWHDIALRIFRREKSLDAFEYQPHYGGLPEDVTTSIRAALKSAEDEDEIRAAFELQPEVKADTDILKLAAALNRMAEAALVKGA